MLVDARKNRALRIAPLLFATATRLQRVADFEERQESKPHTSCLTVAMDRVLGETGAAR